MSMRVLIADKFPTEKQNVLRNLGLEVTFEPKLGPEELIEAIGESQILIVRSTKVTAEAIKAAPHLQLIIRAGAGTNTIDCRAAAELGIAVANCPGKNAIAVAELAMGLVIAIDRHIPDCVADLRLCQWNKSAYGNAHGLFGRALGVVGAGRIGREVLKRAQAFGLKTLAYDPVVDLAELEAMGVKVCETLEELCRSSDVVCVHVPLNDKTRHMFGERELHWLRVGAYFVNASRGGVVDDEALAKVVGEGQIRAACDVYEEEPASGKSEFKTELAKLPGFYGTHHIGASTEQAQNAVADTALQIVQGYLASGEVLNCVNLASFAPARGQLVVRHLDRVGVLANVLSVLSKAEINVQEMQNTIFDGAVAATARIQIERPPTATELADLNACSEDVLGVAWMPNTAN